MTVYKACNWNDIQDDYVLMFWEQNLRQFWIDTEIPVSKDSKVWKSLSAEEKDVYMKVLGGLTLLDTTQGNVGMPFIAMNVEDLTKKAVLTFMGAMEEIHQKSYSTIFTTLAQKDEINDVFKWVEDNKHLQTKAEIIERYYRNIYSKKDLYMAMVASVFLESFLFYSGFFYPLYLAGQGKMTSSGEIINLILRDEAIHGVFVGLLAQEIYNELPVVEQISVDHETIGLLQKLMANEVHYTDEVYGSINLHHDVKNFLKYNANKAMMNLGKDPFYVEVEINPIVLNGLSTDTRTHDFFSVKGNGYQKGVVEPLTDDDFIFDFGG
ncbi:ribonucleoside-diphosphate reductase beta chain [Paenibacillus sp. LBL]|uniref:class 1b ribonucleoside-diphosphate reductase subunit beta n=1 Tax=Paenibacillus sp. LBL TaxID=2940563 RepID=UPI0024732ED7|nr:class 1b ribonucleoside-diphosphate reductase subunit beta [Paenibacillus sp. LBL]MDH6674304.1 ribonucleoside-diphosphate reductase beta chain [Paenibacillus sp. LBL]